MWGTSPSAESSSPSYYTTRSDSCMRLRAAYCAAKCGDESVHEARRASRRWQSSHICPLAEEISLRRVCLLCLGEHTTDRYGRSLNFFSVQWSMASAGVRRSAYSTCFGSPHRALHGLHTRPQVLAEVPASTLRQICESQEARRLTPSTTVEAAMVPCFWPCEQRAPSSVGGGR